MLTFQLFQALASYFRAFRVSKKGPSASALVLLLFSRTNKTNKTTINKTREQELPPIITKRRLRMGNSSGAPKKGLSPDKEEAVLGYDVSVRAIAQRIKALEEANEAGVVVMCGAGISVSAGIPDFRTPGTGLYSNLQKYNLPSPEAVFTISYFRENPKPFGMLAQEVRFDKNEFALSRIFSTWFLGGNRCGPTTLRPRRRTISSNCLKLRFC